MVERASTSISIAPACGTAETKPNEEVEALHRRCGIYTKPEVVRRILDAVGWRSKADLSEYRLLEPAAGNGAFVVEAARRLVAAYVRQDIEVTARKLAGRIRAFELHPREARRARSQVIKVLRELGVHHSTAFACARSWVINGDFLLANMPSDGFTHVVGNPPYIRWSKVPSDLRAKYERRVPRGMVGGDLFLPFLDRALDVLQVKGRCGFLCSDRWRYMAFAEAFRNKWLPQLDIQSEITLSPGEAFVDNVDSYPTILVATKTVTKTQSSLAAAVTSGKTLTELGYVIKVGPALGHTPAFVLEMNERDVEPKLLRPWVDSSEISEGKISWRGRRVIAMHEEDGKLVDLKQFPRLEARLKRFRQILSTRSIVQNGASWFRPIDRVRAVDWTRPKLLIPELAKVPRVTIDRSGAVPSHGVYAVFAPGDDVGSLYKELRGGKLAKALEGIAPKVKGGYVRCYRRFLSMIRI